MKAQCPGNAEIVTTMVVFVMIEDILAENIIGRKVPCNTLVEHICRNFACISHPTHSPKKLAPFYHYILVFGGVAKLAHLQTLYIGFR